MRTIVEIIAAKRDGAPLSDAEIRHVVDSYARGALPEEQMAALAMAIWFKGLDARETGTWTDAMLRSGTVLDLSALPRRVDKHSTGGVGDKVSLILAPAAAACGVTVPMVSGRGLGHTGGTIDKLEAIPGFSADLTVARFEAILGDVGCAIIGATADIAPADKRLYALRDVTATVSSLPLIVSSIMSKKLAEGIEGLVLDVKVGGAAFMRTLPDARALAAGMIAVGERMGVRVIAFITRMDEPLGRMVGNACEVAESVALLEGGGPPELRELIVTLTGAMVEIAHGVSAAEGRARVAASLDDGAARSRFGRMVAAQGGDLAALAPPAGETVVRAPRAGWVTAIDGMAVALTCSRLGAGRRVASDPIDPAVGVRVDAPRGTRVTADAPLCTIFHGDAGPPPPEAVASLAAAFSLGAEPEPTPPLVVERLG
ncbi:MAG: thymidine phosphorylase [Deltaproteobacteria bacterium HGW-Deltaproteobacteria-14]|jgi:pyrimidine-nucleoside phosphorylase/thymidine phosphorylase|nr:MAG: thymidine phosphorylase [Deltaproteobacteria bacterium HGW-Deltaproteobacteria-14]